MVLQAAPQTKVSGPKLAPALVERRNKTLVPGQLPLQAWALMPVISWYTRFGWFGSTATVGSQLLWCFGLMSYPAGRSSSNPPAPNAAVAATATMASDPASATKDRARLRKWAPFARNPAFPVSLVDTGEAPGVNWVSSSYRVPVRRDTRIRGRWRPLAGCINSVQGRTVNVSMATFVPSDLGREVPSTTMRSSC